MGENRLQKEGGPTQSGSAGARGMPWSFMTQVTMLLWWMGWRKGSWGARWSRILEGVTLGSCPHLRRVWRAGKAWVRKQWMSRRLQTQRPLRRPLWTGSRNIGIPHNHDTVLHAAAHVWAHPRLDVVSCKKRITLVRSTCRRSPPGPWQQRSGWVCHAVK